MPVPTRSISPTKLPQPNSTGPREKIRVDGPSTHRYEGRQPHNALPDIIASPSESSTARAQTSQRPKPSQVRVSTAPPSAFKVPNTPTDSSRARSQSLSRTTLSQPGLRRSSDASTQSFSGGVTRINQPSNEQTKVKARPSSPPDRLATSNGSRLLSGTGRRASSSQSDRSRSQSRSSISTYQQQHAPAKLQPDEVPSHFRSRSSTSSTVLPSSIRGPRKSINRAEMEEANLQPPSREVARQQVQLLQLHVLHSAATPTYKTWLKTAYTKLAARHLECQSLYAQHLGLARSARQAQNLLALHRWSNGNPASLIRKLGVLFDVLKEVNDLLGEPKPDDVGQEGEENSNPNGKASGLFITLTRQFEAWMILVQVTWSSRDQGVASSSQTPRIREGDGFTATFDRETQNREGLQGMQPIPGLGDGVKSAMRTLTPALDRLAARAAELRDSPNTWSALEDSTSSIQPIHSDVYSAAGAGLRTTIPTPRELVEVVWTLVDGMRDEVQAMREAEFEVQGGEKARMEQSMRRLGGQLAGAFASTPLR